MLRVDEIMKDTSIVFILLHFFVNLARALFSRLCRTNDHLDGSDNVACLCTSIGCDFNGAKFGAAFLLDRVKHGFHVMFGETD